MQQGPSGFASALAARTPLTVSAPVPSAGADLAASDGWGESIEIVRALSGELPDSASDVVGGISATVKVTGDAYAAGAPQPLRPRDLRAWLGSSIDVAAGYDGLTVPVFSGQVADLDASEADGEVTLSARDAADRLNAPVRLPAFGSTVSAYTLGAVRRYPTNTEAVVVNILHANGIRVTPAPRAGCELSVPCVGGWIADIGWVMPTGAGIAGPWLSAGRLGSAPFGSVNLAGFTRAQCAYLLGYTTVEAFIQMPTGTDRRTAFRLNLFGGSVWVEVEAGRAYVYSSNDSASGLVAQVTGIGTGWQHLAVEVKGNSYVRVWLNGAVYGTSTSTWTVNPGSGFIERVTWGDVRIQGLALHFTSQPGVGPASNISAFEPAADVSRGALDLLTVPEIDGDNSWDTLKQIAQAELGMVGFDELGRFFFRTRADLGARVNPVTTWGVDLVDDIRASASVDAILTRITARVKSAPGIEQTLGGGPLEPVPALVADRIIEIPTGTSSVVLSTSTPFTPGRQVLPSVTTPASAEQTSGFVLCSDRAGTSPYTGTSARAWITPLSQTSVKVTFFSSISSTLYAVVPTNDQWSEPRVDGLVSGGPGLWIYGTRFSDEARTEQTVDRANAAAVATWGTRLNAFGESVWWQDAATVDPFLAAVLNDTAGPRATIADVTVPADPRLQLGDPVRLEDVTGRVPGIVARITSIKLRISLDVEGGMIGTYGLRQIVGTVPDVSGHPVSVTRTVGSTTVMDAAASGFDSQQWQVDRGDGWGDLAGETGSTYTTPAATVGMDGWRYRCVFRSLAGTDYTRPATLTVAAPVVAAPLVTVHPSTEGRYVEVNGPTGAYLVRLDAAATGSGVSCQWQRQVAPSGPWSNIAGATSTQLQHAVTAANGYIGEPATAYRFRAVFTNAGGTTITNPSGVWDVADYVA
ncbi:hypothetical protein [Microbacterium sp. Bi128]|uniref:hypothetical protein n=1 Tax=Microbacterium sp. Bi128 TaxID=2821115 RepID=UPI001D8153C0|nr:hypothetical protein [Microbacterium sp. Bi128]CAH0246827.1 Endoglucanase C [Microbacterium sp. Bi128]